ncbi:hypothetical protein DIJ60_21430 [Burkholderia pseudomallei]|nr:hypothetical protein DIJ60_21430 [Burkholderia pseudomallei]
MPIARSRSARGQARDPAVARRPASRCGPPRDAGHARARRRRGGSRIAGPAPPRPPRLPTNPPAIASALASLCAS